MLNKMNRGKTQEFALYHISLLSNSCTILSVVTGSCSMGFWDGAFHSATCIFQGLNLEAFAMFPPPPHYNSATAPHFISSLYLHSHYASNGRKASLAS